MIRIVPVIVIIVCSVLLIFASRRSGYREGFVYGRRFVLVVLRHVSPDAAEKFRRDIMERYRYDIFCELDGIDMDKRE